jgi:hypothetical protein
MFTFPSDVVLAKWVLEFHDCRDFPDQVKIFFDGHAEHEDGTEDETQYCYVVLIHEDSANMQFRFVDHEDERNSIAYYYIWINGDGVVDAISDGTTSKEIKIFEEVIVKVESLYEEE